MDCYIYFKASSSHESAILEQEQLLLSFMLEYGLSKHRLQKRPQAQDGMQTWMEIHRELAPGFEQALARAYAQTRLAELQSGERHIEYFMDAKLCA
ncbi:DUF4936 family protein [Undibacterium sp. TS12]|uniref:DUF4936 family protein n=1 Tax=Undibacterium sp. TS12 TaxID=2908202 RepID=UPI001F4CA43A|nr:DUF4936 family protein [Undibacterium sp. TS12]MCH8618586.1 DUF4936 family protein [Undibacterium sp. TS12]